MFPLVIIVSVLGLSNANVHPETLTSRIINGKESEISYYPYLASLQAYGSHYCGCSILNEFIVLTAAHCLDKIKPEHSAIRYGSTEWKSGGELRKVDKWIKHELYVPNSLMDYDVALVKVESPITYGPNIKPVAIATSPEKDGTPCVVAGWGYMEHHGTFPDKLNAAVVEILNPKDCLSQFKYRYLGETMMCGVGNGKDSCQGDSGGPMVSVESGKQVGIVSFGMGCGDKSYPGVYTIVANVQDFIKKTAENLGSPLN